MPLFDNRQKSEGYQRRNKTDYAENRNQPNAFNLNAEQKALLTEFEKALQEGGKKHNPKASSWLDGVKKFFENMQI